MVDLTGDADQLEAVLVALTPEAVGMQRLRAQCDRIEGRVEMADRRVDVGRFDRVAAHQMQAVEHLGHPHEVLVVVAVADAARAVEAGHVRRAGHCAERDCVVADVQVVRRIDGVEREARRRLGDVLHHHLAVEAHPVRALLDAGAGLGQHGPRVGVEEVHPHLFEDLHRRVVDRFEALRRHSLDGLVLHPRLGLRALGRKNLTGLASLTAAAFNAGSTAPGAGLFGLVHETTP